jgi:hypothetical protein
MRASFGLRHFDAKTAEPGDIIPYRLRTRKIA